MHHRLQCSAIFSAVNVDITEFEALLVGFGGDVCAEVLSQRRFARTHIASYDDALGHPIGTPQEEAKEFEEEALLSFAMGKLRWDIVYVEF